MSLPPMVLILLFAVNKAGAFVAPLAPSRHAPQFTRILPRTLNKKPMLFPGKIENKAVCKPKTPTSTNMSLQEPAKQLLASLFRSSGGVPLEQAFAINAILFGSLIKLVSKMLTGPGIINGVILGTGLWATLGWKGWTVCVAYLFLGVLVTKVKFADKEKLGIAEKRGGKRGPENLWYVVLSCNLLMDNVM